MPCVPPLHPGACHAHEASVPVSGDRSSCPLVAYPSFERILCFHCIQSTLSRIMPGRKTTAGGARYVSGTPRFAQTPVIKDCWTDQERRSSVIIREKISLAVSPLRKVVPKQRQPTAERREQPHPSKKSRLTTQKLANFGSCLLTSIFVIGGHVVHQRLKEF